MQIIIIKILFIDIFVYLLFQAAKLHIIFHITK